MLFRSEVNIVPIKYSDGLDITKYIAEQPLIAGFCSYSDNINQVLKTAKMVKDAYKDAHITIGGPQINAYEETVLHDNPFVDSVISYEGEETFTELADRLIKNLCLDGCLGLTYRAVDGSIHKNNLRTPIKDLDLLPYPSRDIHEKVRQKYLYIVGSRGCLGGCSFCGETYIKTKMKPPYVRLRSAISIVDEIEFLMKKYDVTAFRFTDATFEDPGEEGFIRANAIFDEIIERRLNISLHIFTRAELVVKEPDSYFEKAKNAGVECFYIGVEAGNDEDLIIYNKKTRVNVSTAAITKIQSAGIHVGIGFICFNPFSTYEKLLNNAEFLYSTHLGHVFYLFQTRLEILPQSSMRKKILEAGLTDKFDYKSHFYDYRFQNPKIGELFSVIRSAYLIPPIYYMDTLLGMDRTYVSKMSEGNTKQKIQTLYKDLDLLCEDYRQKNYELFIACINMSANDANVKQIQNVVQDAKLENIYDQYVDIYNKINIRVSKERILANLKNK